MARTASQLNGIAVVTTTGGERLGRVADVLVDVSQGRVAGFVVNTGGLLARPHFVAASEVQALGPDAVTVARPDALSETVPPHDVFPILSIKQLGGRPVLNQMGTVLGNVTDAMTEDDLTVPALSISTGVVNTALHGHPLLPLSEVVTVGPDSVVVHNSYDPKA